MGAVDRVKKAALGKEVINQSMPMPPTGDALKTNAVVTSASRELFDALTRLEQDSTYMTTSSRVRGAVGRAGPARRVAGPALRQHQ